MAGKIIILVALLLPVIYALNIPVGSTTVEDDDILRRALEIKLRPFGIKDVDVDDYKDQAGVFKVTLTTDITLDQQSKANLSKTLNDLGFSNAKIETITLEERDDDEVESKFLVYLNPSTMLPVLKSLANEVFADKNIPFNVY